MIYSCDLFSLMLFLQLETLFLTWFGTFSLNILNIKCDMMCQVFQWIETDMKAYERSIIAYKDGRDYKNRTILIKKNKINSNSTVGKQPVVAGGQLNVEIRSSVFLPIFHYVFSRAVKEVVVICKSAFCRFTSFSFFLVLTFEPRRM